MLRAGKREHLSRRFFLHRNPSYVNIGVEKEKNIMFNFQAIQVAMLLWACVFNLIAAGCTAINTSFEPHKRRWLLAMQLSGAVLMCCDAFAWAYRGGSGELGYWIVRVSNFLVFFTSDLILLIFHGYVCCCLFEKMSKTERPRRRIVAGYVVSILGMVLVVLSQFTHFYYTFDAQNFYHRTVWYPVSLLIPMVGMLLDGSLLVQYRKNLSYRLYLAMLSYIALPLAASIGLLFVYGVSLVNIAIFISLSLIFAFSQVEQNQKMIAQAEELNETRVAIMFSQIQPHFLYNALTTIKYLCSVQDPRAEDTVAKFAKYLRGNMDSLSLRSPIPFERELDHLENYLAIERLRFPKVQVEYHIEARDFELPALTIQPLVENAIRYGVTRTETGGGTVIVSSWEMQDAWYVSVQDDGVGFDQNRPRSDDRSHIGVDNTRQRIEAMCGGELTIRSVLGRGTIILIRLPKGRKKSK